MRKSAPSLLALVAAAAALPLATPLTAQVANDGVHPAVQPYSGDDVLWSTARQRDRQVSEATVVAGARDAATMDSYAYDFIRDLTTEVGPRQAGTEAEARARAWAVRRLVTAGFDNARIEPFMMPTWVRGEERAELTVPYAMRLAVTALGNSAATPAEGIEGEVVVFRSLADFDAAPDSAVAGRIVYIGHAMQRTQDGSSYSAFGPVRFVGPDRAARRGVRALLIRSIGTDSHRNPHAGNTNFSEGVTPIPAAAISNPDADQLERLGSGVRLRLLLTPRDLGPQESGNVIADIPGTDPAAGIVVAACHLDSWDLGTGAIDDAAGCGIILAAARRVAATHRPRRTIRLLFAGAEEVGIWGGRDYGRVHGAEHHAVALESDFGAGRVWRVDFRLPDGASPVRDRIAAALAPLGIGRGADAASGGADIGALARAGVPLVDLQQDGTRYFDLHHTPDDTFDKIDISDIRQNVAAWTATLYLLANAPEDLGAAPSARP